MKEFNGSHPPIAALRWETRALYTAFLVTMLAGYVAMGALVLTRAGLSADRIVEYYVGDEEQGRYGKTFGELLETTHFHLFSVPLLVLVLGHVFLLTSWPAALKTGLVILSLLAGMAYIAAPWLVVYVSPRFAVFAVVVRVGLAGTLLVFTVVPLYEMWRRPGMGR